MPVAVERKDAVMTLTLDRAEKRNALDAALMRALAAALDEARDDREARVVVLRGRGPMFSSGIDHNFLVEIFQRARVETFAHAHHEMQDVFHRIERMHKPVVAVLHGACVGMAFELALACDFRLATPECALGLPEIAFGIIPDVGGTVRLTRLVGAAKAKELILTGRVVSGAAGARMGLVTEAAADLEARVAKLVADLATHPPAAVGQAKALISQASEVDSATAFRMEGTVQQVLMASPDLAQNVPRALEWIRAQMKSPIV
jgi:enoyl-CoA hydratase/carnithine racemase